MLKMKQRQRIYYSDAHKQSFALVLLGQSSQQEFEEYRFRKRHVLPRTALGSSNTDVFVCCGRENTATQYSYTDLTQSNINTASRARRTGHRHPFSLSTDGRDADFYGDVTSTIARVPNNTKRTDWKRFGQRCEVAQ